MWDAEDMWEVITQEEFDALYVKHKKWLRDEEGGKQLNLCYRSLKNLNLDNYSLNKSIFARCAMEKVSAKGVRLIGSEIYGCRILTSNFSKAYLMQSRIEGSNLRGNKFNGASFVDAFMKDNYFGSCNKIFTAKFTGAIILMPRGIPMCSITGIQGDAGRILTLVAKGKKSRWTFYCGCFSGTLDSMKLWMENHERSEGRYNYDSTMASANFLISLISMRLREDKKKMKTNKTIV